MHFKMLFPLVALVLLEVAGRSLAYGSDSSNDAELYKRLYDFGLGKRAAYSYVSEYKRLPVYNFGLGKRSGDDRRLYSFGLGKRDYDSDEEYEEDLKDEIAKRMKPYSFGLGKRLPSKHYSFGLGKRPEGKMYSFGLGKRSLFTENDPRKISSLGDDYGDISSEEGKRSPSFQNGHKFSFGLGKRDPGGDSRQERSMMYSFGLGKRNLPDQDKETPRSVLVN